MTCTDGVLRTFQVHEKFAVGLLVSVGITNSGTTIKQLNQKTASGKADAEAETLGRLKIAPDVQILDTSKEGGAQTADPAQLAGCTPEDTDARCYALNQNTRFLC